MTFTYYSGRVWASPEYTRYRKRFYMYVCLWGDHFSEERVKIWTRKVMVIMRMHICSHCTRSEHRYYRLLSSIKTIKLKDEVGMTGSKSTQTRFVRDKHLLYIPSLAFLDYYAPISKCWCICRVRSLVVTMVQDSQFWFSCIIFVPLKKQA